MAPGPRWRPARGARLAPPALAAAYAAASVAVVLRGGDATTYAETSAALAALQLVAGVGLVAVGCVAWLERGPRSLGAVTMLTGVVWLAAAWVGWGDGPALARSLGMAAAPFVLPLVAHLVLVLPGGRRVPHAHALVALGYAVTAVLAATRATTRDPFLDPHCWGNCTDNVLLLWAEPDVVRAVDAAWLRVALAGGVLVAALAAWRLLGATRAGRAIAWPVLVPAGLVGLTEAAYAALLLRDPGEDPEVAQYVAVFVARNAALAALAGGVAWLVVRRRRACGAIARLAADLDDVSGPGRLADVLARTLGDTDVRVAYWLADRGRYVDGDGAPLELAARDGQAVTPIVRDGAPVALVLHDRALAGVAELEREIGAAARLAVDNERLRAAVLAQLAELRASRARIVEAADAARRRLERDLHDGAQQRLLALSYDLRLARSAADAHGDPARAARLVAAVGEVDAAFEGLRELAHGIFPAVLTESGLGAALATLADTATIAVEVDGVVEERYAAPVETAAYVVVAEAVADAGRRGASYAAVRVVEAAGLLVVTVRDDGGSRSAALTDVADRVGAVGGAVEIQPRLLRAEIPCG